MSAPCPTFGFHVTIALARDAGAAARDAFLDDWSSFLERHGLYRFSGGGATRLELAVAGEGAQATENERVATCTWLASRQDLTAWRVSELVDLARDG